MNHKYSNTLKKKLVSIILILLLISPSIVSNAYSFTNDYSGITKEYGYKSNKYFNTDFSNYFNNYDYETKDYFKNWKQNTTEDIFINENTEEETSSRTENTKIQEDEYQEVMTDKNNTTEISKYNIEEVIEFLSEIDIYTEIMNSDVNVDIAKEDIVNKITELKEEYEGNVMILSMSDKMLEGIESLKNVDTETLVNTISSYLEEIMSNFENVDWGNVNFDEINFGNIDFGDINFDNINFGNMDFGDISFDDIDFGNIDFSGIFGSSSGDFTPDIVVNDMMAETAGRLSGNEYRVKLSGNIYFSNPDENGNPTSNKWVVLVHGFLMSGESITNTLGQMYLDQGFNILAPDMRGFGDSEGSVALGYLESLDMWDWITYINENYSENCNEIIVHGLSLGGATTVFLSGLEVDGITLKDKNVIGLVEDCGYSSMSEIVAASTSTSDPKSYIMDSLDVGLTEENFDELENGLNSIAKCSLPLLIIHGTDDTTVPYENSDRIYDAAIENEKIPYVQRYSAEGQGHAFIFMGTNYDEYKGHVELFVNKAEEIASRNENTNNEIVIVNSEPTQENIAVEEQNSSNENNSENITKNYFNTETSQENFVLFPSFNTFSNYINIFKNWF